MSDNTLSVIRCEGDNNSLVTRSKIENFNNKSQLIVNESQEALFYKDGQALDLFASGRHALTTEKLPLLHRLFGKLFGGKDPFTCEVYFINKVNVMDILWGTSSPIDLEDPKYHLLIRVGANGQFGIRVQDSRKFVVKIVGQLREFTVDEIKRAIKGMYLSVVRNLIADAIVKEGTSILEISTRLNEMSELVRTQFNKQLESIGLYSEHFYINAISAMPEDLAKLKAAKEKYMEATMDIDIDTMRTVRMGEALAKSRAAQGFTYQDERRFDVMEGAAKNEGNAGGVMGAAMGMGMGFGIGGGMGAAARDISSVMSGETAVSSAPYSPASGALCTGCGKEVPAGAKFCPYCATPVPQAPSKKFCTECGTQVTGEAKFCPNCGHKF